MDIPAIFTLFMAVLALALKPGPGMMALISRTLAHGMPGCLLFMAGVLIVNTFYLSLILLGLRFAHDDLLFISILLKALAAVYLIYLGIKGLQNPDIDMAMKDFKEERLFDNLTAAIMLTLSNPLVIVFFGGLMPSLINVPDMTALDVGIILAVIWGVELGVAVLYCLPFALSRSKMNATHLRKINIGSSLILIAVGIYIGYSALPAKDFLATFG